MENNDIVAAFAENEKEANKYTGRCMSVMAVVVAVVWILNLIGVFIVPQRIMAIAALGAIIFLIAPPLLLFRFMDRSSKWLKVCLMACCIIAITCISTAMPKHGIVAWAAPIVLSCHYYSRKFTYSTLAASILMMGVAIVAGAHYGEWDVSIFIDITMEPNRVFDATIYRRLIVFMFIPRAMTLAGICIVCATLADRTHAMLEKQIKDSMEKQQIASELNIATHIQTSMLPCIFPAFPEHKEFDIYASMTPAKEVGGDFYDFFMVDDRHLAIVMADVSGKGVPAALFMVIGKTLIKDHTDPGRDLGSVFSEVNRILCESNSEGLFITAFEGVLDLVTGQFDFVNAGHEMPFIYRTGGEFIAERIRPGFVLAGMEDMSYRSGSLTLNEGDKLFQYTDGVTEATDAAGKLYGMSRLGEALNRAKDSGAREIVEAIGADIDLFVGDAPQFDDITMLCLSFKKKLKEEELQ